MSLDELTGDDPRSRYAALEAGLGPKVRSFSAALSSRHLESAASAGAGSHESGNRTAKPLRYGHHSRKSNEWPICQVPKHTRPKARHLVGNLLPSHPFAAAFLLNSIIDRARIQTKDPILPWLGQLLVRADTARGTGKKTLRCAPQPPECLQYNCAGYGPLLQHVSKRPRTDWY